MKTILVTGGAGFIGSHLVEHLLDQTGHKVINFDAMTYAADHRALDRFRGHSRYVLEVGDIRDGTRLEQVFARHTPDVVMHLAAESHVDRSVANPLTFVDTNVMGTAQLLTRARIHFETLSAEAKASFRFLHVSTDEVYGSLGPEGLFSEMSPYRPSSPYSASKAGSDHLVHAYGTTFGLPVLISHCSNNYGPRQFPEKLIPLMVVNALQGLPLPVYGDGRQVRDWLHVSDHVHALWLIAQAGKPLETYCIGGNCEQTNIDIVERICDAVDARSAPLGAPRRTLIRFVTDRPGHDVRYAIDATKLSTELGWSPRRRFDEGLTETIEWYLGHESWWRPLLGQSTRKGERSSAFVRLH